MARRCWEVPEIWRLVWLVPVRGPKCQWTSQLLYLPAYLGRYLSLRSLFLYMLGPPGFHLPTPQYPIAQRLQPRGPRTALRYQRAVRIHTAHHTQSLTLSASLHAPLPPATHLSIRRRYACLSPHRFLSASIQPCTCAKTSPHPLT